MTPYQCCTLVQEAYNEIGSGYVGFAANAIECVVIALNDVASNESLPLETRKKAAQACANLLISDYNNQ